MFEFVIRWSYILDNNKLHSVSTSCCGVVVITSVLHTEGLQFDPGQQQLINFTSIFFLSEMQVLLFIEFASLLS